LNFFLHFGRNLLRRWWRTIELLEDFTDIADFHLPFDFPLLFPLALNLFGNIVVRCELQPRFVNDPLNLAN
jgi:hypothetical protein